MRSFSEPRWLWVSSGPIRALPMMSGLPPLATELQTSLVSCHVWTAPGWQELSSRFCSIGRCSHVFGSLMRFTWPLAIMPSADQVPTNNSHSRMLWHMWVVLIAGSTGSALRAVRPPNLHIAPVAWRDLVIAQARRGSLYRSPLAIIAQTIRAILLPSAIAVTLVGRHASKAVSQGRCLVPWILA